MGKSSSTVAGFHYLIFYQAGLVGRPIDAFLGYYAAEKPAWEGELTASGRFIVNAPQLFGGEKDQGGIVGPVDVMFGDADQLPNPYLVSMRGDEVVAWRGMTTLVFAGGRYGAMSPFAQKPSYKIRKILKGWDDDDCWYPEKAPIQLSGVYVPAETIGSYGVLGLAVGASLITSTSQWSDSTADPVPDSSIFELAPPSDDYPYNAPRRVIVRAASSVVWDSGWIGMPAEQPDLDAALLAADREDLAGTIQDRSSISSLMRFFGSAPADLDIEFYAVYTAPSPEQVQVTLNFKSPEVDTREYGVNPAHALYYVRTDREKGREPRANINNASLTAAADQLFAEGFGLCLEYDPEKDTPDAYEERICKIIGGSFERSLVDGQWHLTLARPGYDLDELPILGDDDILSFKELPATLDRATNSLAVRYFDMERRETVITPAVRALGLIRQFGEMHEVLDFPEIPNGTLALTVATRELRSRITPGKAYEMVTQPDSTPDWLLNSRFRLQSLKRRIADMVCFLGEKQAGTLRSGAISIKAAQDVLSFADAVYIEIETGVDTRPPQTPQPIEYSRVFEAPYIDVAAGLPRSELLVLPADVGYLLGVGAAVPGGLDYSMFVSPDDVDYARVANGEWCPTATAAAVIPLAGGPTVVPLGNGDRLDQVAVGSPVLFGDEIGRVDAIDTDAPSVTLGRGCADTVPAEHAAGTRLWFFADHVAIDTTEYTDGETIDVKLLTNTGSQQLPEIAASPMALTFDQRQFRPYPPANVTLAGVWPAPVNVYETFTITLAHRDRILQADQLVDWSMASIGPEAGVSYQARFYDDANTLVHTTTATSADHFDVLFTFAGNVRMELVSLREGVECLQPVRAQFFYSSDPPVPRTFEDGTPRTFEDGTPRIF